MEQFLIRGSGGHFAGWWAEGSTVLWSGVLRVAETFVEALPFLIAGMLSAGILRGMVGPDRLRALLTKGTWTGPIRAWALGILLPICALGALPVASELRRARIPSGTVISFVLVAPVLNPVSVVYGLSHVNLLTMLYFVVGTFLISVGIGMLWNRMVAKRLDTGGQEDERLPASGSGRLAMSAVAACQVLLGPVLVDFLLVLLVMGFLGAFLPYGVLQTAFTRDNPLAPVVMACVAIPAYVTPMEVMVHFEHIVRDGYSLAAAFVLVVLGAGANVGVANWLRRDYGWRSLGLFALMLIVSTLLVGGLADRSFGVGSKIMKDHTHAFDSFTRLPTGGSYDASYVLAELQQQMLPSQQWGLVAFAAMTLAGLSLRWRGGQLAQWTRRKIDALDLRMADQGLNRSLSPKTVVIVAVTLSLGFGTVLAYVYYPPASTLFSDVAAVRTELYQEVLSEDPMACHRRLEQVEALLSKFPVSQFLRHGGLTEPEKAQLKDLLERVDVLREFLIRRDFAAAKTVMPYVERGYSKFYEVLTAPKSPGGPAVGPSPRDSAQQEGSNTTP